MATSISKIYTHRVLKSEQIVEMLKNRGLAFTDEVAAIAFLKDVSYFRIASYLRPMEADKIIHVFKPNASFEKAVELYRFDSDLRQLIFKAIQNIEVSLRTHMIQDFSDASDPFWFFDESQCSDKHNFLENMAHVERELQRCKEEFIKEHYKKYGADCFPPAWKTLEIITFGSLSKLFCNYNKSNIKKRIARSFCVPQHEILESWMKSVNALRNGCAHHARIWNRAFAQIPLLPSNMKNTWIKCAGIDTTRLYAALYCIVYWLNSIHPTNTFVADFKALLAKYPNVDTAAMGFPADWQDEPLWK